MIAFKELKQLTPERVHGHIPGVEVGARFGVGARLPSWASILK